MKEKEITQKKGRKKQKKAQQLNAPVVLSIQSTMNLAFLMEIRRIEGEDKMRKNKESRRWRRGEYQTSEGKETESRDESKRHLRVGGEVPKKRRGHCY